MTVRVEFTDNQIRFLATLLQKIDSGSRFYRDPKWKGHNARERQLFDGLMDRFLDLEEIVDTEGQR